MEISTYHMLKYLLKILYETALVEKPILIGFMDLQVGKDRELTTSFLIPIYGWFVEAMGGNILFGGSISIIKSYKFLWLGLKRINTGRFGGKKGKLHK
jgi:hypothetical protein